MITRDNCRFAYFVNGVKTADVTIKNGVVSTVRYTDEMLDLPFGRVPDRLITRRTVDLFFRERCVPEHRANLRDFLDFYGLEQFNAFAICCVTNSQMAQEPYFIEWYG
jgi:hypothetical protein